MFEIRTFRMLKKKKNPKYSFDYLNTHTMVYFVVNFIKGRMSCSFTCFYFRYQLKCLHALEKLIIFLILSISASPLFTLCLKCSVSAPVSLLPPFLKALGENPRGPTGAGLVHMLYAEPC